MTKRNIVHIEIPAADSAKAGEFYRTLFGWNIVRDEALGYTMWDPPEGPGGGFNPLGENLKPGDILIYVDSVDIEADLKHVESLGGKVVTPKMEIPGVGWFGIFLDPTGNKIALYTSKNVDFNK